MFGSLLSFHSSEDTGAQKGNTVKVHYSGTLNDGHVFDTTHGDDPLEFKIGEGMLLQKFEDAVLGLGAGDKVVIELSEDDAYGPYLEEQKFEVPKSELPKDITPEPGMMIQGHTEDGSQHMFAIAEVLEKTVVMDANHPLAGQDLTFEIELVEIVN